MTVMRELTALEKNINSQLGIHPAAHLQHDTNSVIFIIETPLPDQDMAMMLVKMSGLALGSCHLLHSGFLVVL